MPLRMPVQITCAHPRVLQVLNSIPDLDLLHFLPQLLAGLLHMLADPTREVGWLDEEGQLQCEAAWN